MKQDFIVWTLPFQDTQERLQQEEDARNQLFQGKKKLEQEIAGLKKDIEDLELTVQKVNTWWLWLFCYDITTPCSVIETYRHCGRHSTSVFKLEAVHPRRRWSLWLAEMLKFQNFLASCDTLLTEQGIYVVRK